MIVRCKKSPYPDAVFIMDELDNSLCDAETIVCTGAPSNLIKKYEALWSRIVQDIGKFHHLDHKSALPACKVVECTNACKNPVHDAHRCIRCRHETPHLGHYYYKCRLPHVR